MAVWSFFIDCDNLVFGLALSLLIFWFGYFMVHLLAICYGKWKLHRKPVVDLEKVSLPGVSILKPIASPIVGTDPHLFSNLETFFTLKYPQYELIFCIQNESDSAVALVDTLRKKYPNVSTKKFVGGELVGLNPKINNMAPGYAAAKYEFILISDAGMRMKEDTLLDMVLAMEDNVGMITQMPFTCDRKGFAATLEKVYFGTAHARIYLSADWAGVVCSTGMSSMFRKTVMEELGGMKQFSQYLAEDYFFAHAFVSKGWKCTISSQPGWQNSGICQVGAFHDRTSRWAKLRMAMIPHTIILEPLQECFLLGLISSWAVNVLFGWNSLIFLLVHVLAWMLLDYVLLSVVQNGPLPFGKFEYVISWLYREITALPVFLRALWNPVVIWRTGVYRLKWGGIAEEIITRKPLHTIHHT